MKLNLYVVQELLEGRFPLLAADVEPQRLFDNVKCYLGQAVLSDFTLYLVPQRRQDAFTAASRRLSVFFPAVFDIHGHIINEPVS